MALQHHHNTSGRRPRTLSAATGAESRPNLAAKSKSTQSVGVAKEYPEYLDGTGTPTPSEKVSRWHRDIFLMSPCDKAHPRQCICDQCMAEYGTFKFYNEVLQAQPEGAQVPEEAVKAAAKATAAGAEVMARKKGGPMRGINLRMVTGGKKQAAGGSTVRTRSNNDGIIK